MPHPPFGAALSKVRFEPRFQAAYPAFGSPQARVLSGLPISRLDDGGLGRENKGFFKNYTKDFYHSTTFPLFMASILFSKPEGERQHAHDALLDRLRQEHEVTDLADALGFLWELHHCRFSGGERYDLIVYDSGFFWGEAPKERRVELFEKFALDYLRFAQTPVLILADEEMKEEIRPIVTHAGFGQVDCPYSIEEVLITIDELTER